MDAVGSKPNRRGLYKKRAVQGRGMTSNIRKRAAANIVITILAGIAAFAMFLAVLFVALIVAIPFMNS